MVEWGWERQSRNYANFGNANQWTVNAGLTSLARESAQNTNDARLPDAESEVVYTFLRLTGEARASFEQALRWDDQLRPHLAAMAEAATGSVSAGQIGVGLEAVESSDSLLLLRVADFGCTGLTGPEFTGGDVPMDQYGNFIKLCRLDLFSGKDKAAGGSFGLGKAVYWRFSRLQTVMFNSTLAQPEPTSGRSMNRLFGVNQGVMHTVEQVAYQGRGHFGVPDGGDIASVWGNSSLVSRLQVNRDDPRPGTTALIVGFYDPDNPDLALTNSADIEVFVEQLRLGIEENFWPLLTRNRLGVTVEVVDNGDLVARHRIDAESTYGELVRALRRFDAGATDGTLDEAGSVVVRDIPIKIPKRRTPDQHDPFVHHAKLVVTMSDDEQDTLENRVCLFRKPEMVVETIERSYDGRNYHAFLVAGAAINPDSPTVDDLKADDFLRFAEPPAHDRWIPRTGRHQASQANLTANYSPPWLPNLRDMEKEVVNALNSLFGAPPPPADKPPESIFKHLRFLRGERGDGGAGASRLRKPQIDMLEWKVTEGRWYVSFQIEARNRREGWSVEPVMTLVGLDGRHHVVLWDELTVESGGELVEGVVVMRSIERRRLLHSVVTGVSTADLPIPAVEAGVDVVPRKIGVATHPRRTRRT